MQQHEVRRAQLVAAAEALVSWIHARRATWPELPVDVVPRPESRPAVPPPIAAPPKATRVAPVVSTVTEPEAVAFEQPASKESTRWTRKVGEMATAAFGLVMAALRLTIRVLRLTIAALGSLAGSLRRRQSLASTVFGRLRRAAAYAAVLGIVLAAGWLARPYWPMVVARLTAPLPQQAEAPPEEPVAPGQATAGQLIARSEPPGARVTIDGEPRGVTPLTVDGLSLGRHTVVIETDQGSVRRTVTVTADRPALVSESIFAGFLKVFAPFELRITDGRRAIQLDDQNQALLPPGSYALQLENASLGYRDTRRVEVNPGQTTTLSIVPPPSALTVTASAPAVVLVDGEQVGETPLTNHPIALGTRDIVVRSIAGPERRYTRRVTVAPIQIEVDFSRP